MTPDDEKPAAVAAGDSAPGESTGGSSPGAGSSAPSGESPLSAARDAGHDDPFAERPELYVGGAFVGGLAVALILRALGNR